MINAIIIEDESGALKSLLKKIEENCPQVNVVTSSHNVEEAIANIYEYQPELIFLDVQLGDLSGFDVLARIKPFSFQVIFTTSYPDYAIPAIKADALDYLLKPVKIAELKAAVNKALYKIKSQKKEGLPVSSKIAVPVSGRSDDLVSIRFLDPEYIIYCKADDRHSILHLYKNSPLRIHRKLGDLENQLCNNIFPFLRTHRSYIVNVDYVESYTKERLLNMTTGDTIPLAGSYKDQFWEYFKKHS